MLCLNKKSIINSKFKWTKIASLVTPQEEADPITRMMMTHSMLKEMLNKMTMTKERTHPSKQNINLQKLRKKESSRKKKSHPKDSKNHVKRL